MPKSKVDSKESAPKKAASQTRSSSEDVQKQSKFTIYEKTRLLATRTLQLSDNAPSYIDPQKGIDSYSLAKEEMNKDKMPLKVSKKKN